LFNEGLSVEEIVAQRGISKITVETHLSDFVQSGELSVLRLLSQETLNELTPWINAAIAEDNLRLAPIKEAVGEKFSYADIRLAMSHCLREWDKQRE
jgi:ATP-dependent DNA helicase RecQ